MNRRRSISLLDKQRIVDAYNNPNADYVEVAAALDIPRGTAWSIVRRYLEDGEVVVRRGGGRRPVAREEMIGNSIEWGRPATPCESYPDDLDLLG